MCKTFISPRHLLRPKIATAASFALPVDFIPGSQPHPCLVGLAPARPEHVKATPVLVAGPNASEDGIDELLRRVGLEPMPREKRMDRDPIIRLAMSAHAIA